MLRNEFLASMSKANCKNAEIRDESGPFEVAFDTSSQGLSDSVAPDASLPQQNDAANQDVLERRLECNHYEECLNLAAALDWDSFTCTGCNGEIDETLLWRAGQNTKRDALAKAICGAATRSALKGTSQK
jgi:predicted Fe-S protein YdhL (DUF1289 family)